MSLNIRFDATPGVKSDQANAWLANSGAHRRDLALQAISHNDPDILCVQEALTNQIKDLQAELSGHEFYGVGRDDGVEAGEYCGIFYRRNRFVATDQGTFWLNEKTDQPGSRFPNTCCARIAAWIILQDKAAGNREYFLLNTHWDHQVQDARLFSAELIRQRLAVLAGKRPVLIAGDLNATTENPAFQRLVRSTPQHGWQLFDSFRELHPERQADEGTFHAFRGNTDGSRIDYVLHSKEFQTRSAEIIRFHDQQRYPSDHFPVTATLVPVE